MQSQGNLMNLPRRKFLHLAAGAAGGVAHRDGARLSDAAGGALRARGDRKCKTLLRSDLYRGGVLCSVRE
jgi:hypothetical protein